MSCDEVCVCVCVCHVMKCVCVNMLLFCSLPWSLSHPLPHTCPTPTGTNTGEDLFYREISSLKSYLRELEARIECMEKAHSGRTTVIV